MPDLTPPGRPDPARLARGVGREIVVVHVALARLRLYGIEPLGKPQIRQCERRKYLRLAAGEEPGAVHARYHPDLGLGRSDLVKAPEVGALAVLQKQLPESLLLEGGDGGLYLLGLLFFAPLDELGRERVQGLVAAPPVGADDGVLDPIQVLLAQVAEERVLFDLGPELLPLFAELLSPAFDGLGLFAD